MIARTNGTLGSIPHMCLDTKGQVTVGTGHMIRTATADRGTSAAATAAQENADPVEVAKQKTAICCHSSCADQR